jgi:soluble lytic murein transglycosylase-like protein
MKPAILPRLLITGLLATLPVAAAAQNAVAVPVAAVGLAAASQPLQIVSGVTPEQRTRYRAIFAAIDSGDWTAAQTGIDTMSNGPLTDIALAQLILAKGSPKVSDETLKNLLAGATDLPQAFDLAAIASRRGLSTPALPMARDMVRFAGPSKRQSARALRNDRAASALKGSAMPLLRNDQPSAGEAIVNARLADLSPEAKAEWLQRVAWSYYLSGDDANARRVADQARVGVGDWAVQASWVSGLAAWRQKDCLAAGIAFEELSTRARDPEMIAAGLYWASRADMACNHPERVEARLRSAARMKESFYGLIAQAALGLSDDAASGVKLTANDWAAIGAIPNVRRATALAEIGETKLAEQLLRHQAKIGHSRDHESLIHLAARLNLPSTQIWLAQNGPSGTRLSAAARYPVPAWTPTSGWKVDKALVFAHALQESQFRTDATSSAGARGVMQLMPATAQMVARHEGLSLDSGALAQPATNIALGQAYLRELAGNSGTGGLLPKVIAAYNAGPTSVANWNARGRNLADPLLFIESIPFTETRAYVAIVLRNYWMYQRHTGAQPISLKAVAQGLWPRFPGLPGREAVRLTSLGATAAAD